MSTFSRLTLLAQYDDMCRLVNKLIKDSADEEDATLRMLNGLQKRWDNREAAHEKEVGELKNEIGTLQKDMKKLSRQLAESRAALVRESNDKKSIARERKALTEQIRQVRLLLETNEGFENNDANRRRVMKYLDADRLSPIPSNESDDSDNCVDLDYDKTEEDILETIRPQRRTSTKEPTSVFNEVLENLPSTEQPTILCRYFNGNSEEDDHDMAKTRRKSRRTATQQVTGLGSEPKSRSALTMDTRIKSKDGQNHQTNETESESNGMDTDDNEIERCREQLKQMEREKKDKLASVNSTPNVKIMHRGSTLSAKSTASLMKINSQLTSNKPMTPSIMKPHVFVSKKCFKPDKCGPCGGKISFYTNVAKCEGCGLTAHPECKDKCPMPCVKITAPTGSRQKKILVSDYVGNTEPKVPAIIVHCCNEIERHDKIRSRNLYRVAEDSRQIEGLLMRILSSKSGMPNLSHVDVHVLTGVVKKFLQKLDETLVTTSLWSYFAEAVKLDSDVEGLTHIEYHITHDLPTANRETLAYLMQHFHAIARNSEYNNMTLKDLAKALAPTIVGNSCRNPQQTTLLTESKTQLQIMEALFKIKEDFWEQFVQRTIPVSQVSLGNRLLGTPTSSSGVKTRSSRLGSTLPTPKLKPLFSG